MTVSSRVVKAGLKQVLRGLFESGQHLGVDVLPRHFYSEVPDLRALRRSPSWKRPYSMIGVAGTDLASQLTFLRGCCSERVLHHLERADVHEHAIAMNGHEGFGPVEADMLYAFVATHRPAHIFQIGCGVSTAICMLAATDAGYTPRITCVEPYPNDYLRRLASEQRIILEECKAEELAFGVIESLDADVLFFVDSSHTLGPAGEVSRIVLEMLPRLKTGAWVHFHDIFFPYDYDRQLLTQTLFFHHESVLLHAFLACNPRFEVRAALSMLHYARPQELGSLLRRYRPAGNDEGLETRPGHFPSSIYLQVVEQASTGYVPRRLVS